MDQGVERGRRIEHVRLALAVPLRGNVTAKRFGELVAAEEGRKAYDGATPTRWEAGATPSIPAIEAMCRIARRAGLTYVSRAWLAFGDGGVTEARDAPPAPAITPRETEVKLSGHIPADAVRPAPRAAKKKLRSATK